MRRTWSLLLILFLTFSGFNLFAQEEPETEEGTDIPSEDSDWANVIEAPYSRGDKTITISLGILFPTYFGGEIANNAHGLSLGGTGSLAFNYFLSPGFFIGGELAGSFSSTRGGNMLYIVPFGFRVGYQFMIRRFEIPVSLMAGAAPQRYLGQGYFGPVLRPGVSVFWRFNPEWSFGLNGVWWFVPEWPANGHDAYGNFVELTLSARYQF